MTVHILRTAAGTPDLDTLAQRQQEHGLAQRGGRDVIVVTTRNKPLRANEVLDGGSIFWIIKNQIQARQEILDLEIVVAEDGRKQCLFILEPEIMRVRPRRKRAVQGWRYFDVSKAPEDVAVFHSVQGGDMPEDMALELRELGLL